MKNKKIIFPIIALVIFAIIISIGVATENKGESVGFKIPASSSEYKGENYQTVASELQDIGFVNVETEIIDDLVTASTIKDGAVESVSVDGEVNYDLDAVYSENVKIVVSYHTLTKHESNDTKANPEQPEKSSETTKEDEILTEYNCEELKNIFVLKSGHDAAFKAFTEKYKGKIIEFDGRVDAVANHSSYNAFNGSTSVSEYEYDILLGCGDFDPNTGVGPAMRVENVSSLKLGLDVSKTLPDFMNVGSNVHVRVKVGSYNEDTGIITMYYDLIEAR